MKKVGNVENETCQFPKRVHLVTAYRNHIDQNESIAPLVIDYPATLTSCIEEPTHKHTPSHSLVLPPLADAI